MTHNFQNNYSLLLGLQKEKDLIALLGVGKTRDLIAAGVLENFLYWENKNKYLNLIERFLSQEINDRIFCTKFQKMWENDRDKFYTSNIWIEKLEKVNLKKLYGFSEIISSIFIASDVFNPNPNTRADCEISEHELRNEVREALIRIKNDYP